MSPACLGPDRGNSPFVPYFDCNATTPLSPRAREAWLRAADDAWQNPSSPYRAAALSAVDAELGPAASPDEAGMDGGHGRR
jgi:hypothetical protein